VTTEPEYPHVRDWQRNIVAAYGDLLNNTGGNDPLDLLNDLQRPGTDERPNRLMSVNVVRFSLALGVSCQVSLLRTLIEKGRI
jgi:hypothetical protein